jgi:hypothetical protein
MAEPPDDEKDKDKSQTGEEESGGEKGRSGGASGGGVGFFGEKPQEKKKREDTDDGSGTSAKGFTRPSGEGILKLTTDQQKTVWTDFRRLDFSQAVAAIAEFFNEYPARASANMSVAWGNIKGVAIINMSIKFGQDVATAVRERTKESAVAVKRRYGISVQAARRGPPRVNSAPPIKPPRAG